MTTLIQEVQKKLNAIKADNTTIEVFNKLANSMLLENELVQRSFIQISQHPNPQLQGLAVEVLIITKDKLHDIVVGVSNLTINTVWIKEIVKVELFVNSTHRRTVMGATEQTISDFHTQLNIMYSSGHTLYYKANLDRYQDCVDIRNLIIKIKSHAI
ncbi:MAG: hypothetical protein V4580_20010 [Bacteroidota bacterium]